MRVATVNTMHCPRCDAPVKGDFKYCPECACRLRIQAAPAETPPEGGRKGALLLGLVAAGLLAAGIFVGNRVLGDRPMPPLTSQVSPILSMDDVHDSWVSVSEGIAFWEPDIVLAAPPEDEVDPRLLRSFKRGDLSRFLDRVVEEPRHLTRWSKIVSLIHTRTRDLMEEKVRHTPIRTRPFRAMRYEVSRGQYAEFLRDVGADPAQLFRLFRGLEDLWRPKGRPDWAVNIRRDYWNAVSERLRRRMALDLLPAKTEPEPDDQKEPLSRAEPGAADPPLPELPPIPVPAFIEAERLDTLSDADAVKLLYPASWVRMDESGTLYWVLEPGTENLPVTDISWWDAQLFVVWARQRLGLNTLRVPSWAEWVRAFHGNHPAKPIDDFDDAGDSGWRWPWGNAVDPHGCNNLNHTWNDPVPTIRDVRRPYGWHDGDTVDGIFSMAGNAAEWTNGSRIEVFATGLNYVLKDDPREGDTDRAFAYGGSYLAGLDDCSVKSGVSLRKTERRIDVGFRLVLDATGP